jgi:hypothetical protein
MPSSGTLHRVALVRTDVLEERIISIISVTKFGLIRSLLRLLVTANIVPNSPIFVTLMIEAIRFSESTVITIAARRNIPKDGILNSHRRQNLKSYIKSHWVRN